MKKIIVLLLALFISVTLSFGHGGRTDKNGGHYNRKTGEYHYHNSGSSNSENNGVIVFMVIIGIVAIFIISLNFKKK